MECFSMQTHSRLLFFILLFAVGILLSCRTTDLLGGDVARATPTRKPAAQATKPQPTRDPNAGLEFVPIGAPHCGVGDNNASVVRGRILENGAPLAGQRVTASSGPGAEPISDEPAVSNEQGIYQVTFVCDGKACDGAFWIWLVDEDYAQVSPFVQFIFDNNCRRGTLDFRAR